MWNVCMKSSISEVRRTVRGRQAVARRAMVSPGERSPEFARRSLRVSFQTSPFNLPPESPITIFEGRQRRFSGGSFYIKHTRSTERARLQKGFAARSGCGEETRFAREWLRPQRLRCSNTMPAGNILGSRFSRIKGFRLPPACPTDPSLGLFSVSWNCTSAVMNQPAFSSAS